MQYRRTPLDSDYSPCELLNGRQIRSKLEALFPSPAHVAQGKQARKATKSQRKEHNNSAVWIITVSHRPFSIQNIAMAVHFSLLPDETAGKLQFVAYINFRSLRILFIHRSFKLLLQ